MGIPPYKNISMDRLSGKQVGRLITSPKSHPGIEQEVFTFFGGRYRSITEIIGLYSGWIIDKLEREAGKRSDTMIVSHSIEFGPTKKLHDLVVSRLEEAIRSNGIKYIITEPEPISAARKYTSDSEKEGTLLVVDVGGGTTDFAVVKSKNGQMDILGTSGVYVGGDTYDQVASHIFDGALGKNASYKSWDKQLDVPGQWYDRLSDWNNVNQELSAKEVDALTRTSNQITTTEDKKSFKRLLHILNNQMIDE